MEDAPDVRLALRARTERRGIGQERAEELDRDDLLSLEVDRVDAREAAVLEALQMREVALSEGHEEADALDALQVAAEGLELLVVEKVHVLLADLVEHVLALDRHRRRLDPVALVIGLLVLDRNAMLVKNRRRPLFTSTAFRHLLVRHPVRSLRGHLADVDLGIEVRRERIPVVAAVAVEDVQGLDRVEIMLLRIGREDLRDAGVEAAAEDRGEARLLELLAVLPLPRILEVRLFRRLVVRRVEIAHAGRQARVHDREVLVGERDVHDEVGTVALDERGELRHVHRVDLRGGDLRRVRLRLRPDALPLRDTLLDVVLDRDAARFRARGDEKLAEHVGILTHLGRGNARDTTCSDEHDLLSHVTAPFHVGLDC